MIKDKVRVGTLVLAILLVGVVLIPAAGAQNPTSLGMAYWELIGSENNRIYVGS